MNAADLDAIRLIVREEIRAAFGAPLATGPSLHDEVTKMVEDKRRELEEKRAKRAARAAAKGGGR